MIVDEIVKQLKTIIEELEVLDEFLQQYSEDANGDEVDEGSEEDTEDRDETEKKRPSLVDLLQAKME